MKPTVAFHTLGCKLNFAETSAIGLQLKNSGFRKVDFEEGADVVVINTCSVTENADRECRMIVRRALQKNKESFIAVIGCYAQLKPDEISSINGVDLVLGASEKFNIAGYLENISKKENTEVYSCSISEVNSFEPAYSFGDRTRTILKVQDGCDYPCTYCTIPLARGSGRSATIEQVIKQAEEIARKGSKEIVLTGVNLGDFGNHENDFFELIKQLDKVNNVERFRISSIEPNLLKNEIIDFVSTSKRFAPHFHLPLQSGSDKILRLMRRRYRRDLYADRVNKIKSVLPHASIGADVIVGFPGETDEDFLETYNFIRDLTISYLHVFTYSERENTVAFDLPDKVDISIRKKRNKMLRILSEKKRQEFYHSSIGSKGVVLFENESFDGYMHGFTENYIKIKYPYDSSMINKRVNMSLSKFDGSLCMEAEIETIEVLNEN